MGVEETAEFRGEGKEIMSNNFPPGVTGNEYAIAGPDYEKESDIPCPKCGDETIEQGYHWDRWIYCVECDLVTEIEDDPGDDPDRKYDEERDRKMLGIDRPDGLEE